MKPLISSLTLLQLMKAVVFLAVAFACVLPLLRTWADGSLNEGTWKGLLGVAIFGLIAVPAAWTGLTFVLIRPGRWRDGLVASLLLCSVTVALACAVWVLVDFIIPSFFNGTEQVSLPSAMFHAAIIVFLGAACFFLSRRLWRGYHPIVPEAHQ